MNNDDHLSVDNFRRWIKNHPGSEEAPEMVGMEVQAKYSAKKTIKNMLVEFGSAGKVIREFMDEGGVVKEVSGNEYMVEVASGVFSIHKRFLTT